MGIKTPRIKKLFYNRIAFILGFIGCGGLISYDTMFVFLVITILWLLWDKGNIKSE